MTMRLSAICMMIMLVSAGCAQQTQMVKWRRIGSSPTDIASGGTQAQSLLRSDFAECALYVRATVGREDASSAGTTGNSQKNLDDLEKSDRWKLMQTCMHSKGWDYVAAGYQSTWTPGSDPVSIQDQQNATPEFSTDVPAAAPMAPVMQDQSYQPQQPVYQQPVYQQQSQVYQQPVYQQQQPMYQAQPAYAQPQMGYYQPQPQPVYAQPQPVYAQPQPTYTMQPAPSYYPPQQQAQTVSVSPYGSVTQNGTTRYTTAQPSANANYNMTSSTYTQTLSSVAQPQKPTYREQGFSYQSPSGMTQMQTTTTYVAPIRIQ